MGSAFLSRFPLLRSSLLPTLTPASFDASAFSPSLQPLPTAGPRGASRMTGGRLRPGPQQGEGAGPGRGGSCGFPAPEEAAARADLQQLRRWPRAGGCPGCALRAAHPVSGLRRAGLGLGSVIRSRKSEPCQGSAGLWSVGATPSLRARDSGKDFVRVQEEARVLIDPETPPTPPASVPGPPG